MATQNNGKTKSVEKQIEALGRMNVASLRKAYKAAFGKETAATNREALRRRVAARLKELGSGDVARARPRDERLPPAGTVLERTYEGRTYKVTVLDEGFQYGNATYGSLSTIAKEITDTIWNGYVFFARALKEASS